MARPSASVWAGGPTYLEPQPGVTVPGLHAVDMSSLGYQINPFPFTTNPGGVISSGPPSVGGPPAGGVNPGGPIRPIGGTYGLTPTTITSGRAAGGTPIGPVQPVTGNVRTHYYNAYRGIQPFSTANPGRGDNPGGPILGAYGRAPLPPTAKGALP